MLIYMCILLNIIYYVSGQSILVNFESAIYFSFGYVPNPFFVKRQM